MSNGSAPVIVRRYAASHLCDVVYGIQPMTTEMAEVIRTLRRDHRVDYARLGFYLCESTLTGEVRSDWARRSLSLQPITLMIMIAPGFSRMILAVPNQAAPVNAPIALWFHDEHPWRRVTEQHR